MVTIERYDALTGPVVVDSGRDAEGNVIERSLDEVRKELHILQDSDPSAYFYIEIR